MNQSEFSTRLRTEVEMYREGFRDPSAAFLMWYLVNFFRLSPDEVKDSICDNTGDKGIDGVWVDETSDEEEIYLFQSKFSPTDGANQGDNDLRNFVGAKSWFDSPEQVQKLLESTANKELKSLIESFKIADKVSKGCRVNAIFITNKVFDYNANEFLGAQSDELEGYDFPKIFSSYSYVAEEEPVKAETSLNLVNNTVISYDLPSNVKVIVLPLQARELLKLEGIQNNSLFSKNVRYGLGKTRVNKDIANTLKNPAEHTKFFLYHNGITIVCEGLTHQANSVKISNYSVVNGCQSMLTFYENASSITDNIYVPTKIIQIPKNAPVSIADITYWANNQNSISVRDLKANDVIQRALQREFEELFEKKVLYRRQRGASAEGYDEVIERDFAAQLIAAFYLKEPEITHLRTKLFTDGYYDIFSIHMNAAKIYLANIIYNVIASNVNGIEFEPIRNYGLARFLFLTIVGELLESDSKGREILENPENHVNEPNLGRFKQAIEKLFKLTVFDVNNFVADWMKAHDNFFDYKNFFKSKHQTGEMIQGVTTSYKKNLIHHPEDAFSEIYSSSSP